jgi:hypothetical protein
MLDDSFWTDLQEASRPSKVRVGWRACLSDVHVRYPVSKSVHFRHVSAVLVAYDLWDHVSIELNIALTLPDYIHV